MAEYEQLSIWDNLIEKEPKTKERTEIEERTEVEEGKGAEKEIKVKMKKEAKTETYYEQLGVLDNATKTEIKKAYFVMVKKYPPERFPEEFKAYRKAYEVLSDENAREQYDKLSKVPKKYKDLYDSALVALNIGDYETGIRQLKAVVKENPELQILNSLLGDIYLENENSGNAIKIFERLTQLEPGNSSYHGKLARAYQMRGFTKKAVTQYEKTVSMDSDNAEYWTGLANSYWDVGKERKAIEIINNGITRFLENGLDSLELHMTAAVFFCQSGSSDELDEQLKVIKEKAKNDPAIKDYIAERLLFTLFSSKPKAEDVKSYYQVISLICELAPENELIGRIKQVLQTESSLHEIDSDERIIDTILIMTDFSISDCSCIICRIRRAVIESEMVADITKTRKSLKYLRETYPDIYSLNQSFYDQVLDPKKEKRLLEKSCREISKYQRKNPSEFQEAIYGLGGGKEFAEEGILDEEDEMDFMNSMFTEQEPFVRESPKIGRNDPCPCGSGKKYKKCCGANI